MCYPWPLVLFTGLVAVVIASYEYCNRDWILPAAELVLRQPLIACLQNPLPFSEHTAQQNRSRTTEIPSLAFLCGEKKLTPNYRIEKKNKSQLSQMLAGMAAPSLQLHRWERESCLSTAGPRSSPEMPSESTLYKSQTSSSFFCVRVWCDSRNPTK